LEWFSGRLPKNVEVVDGFNSPLPIILGQLSLSVLSIATKRSRADNDSQSEVLQRMGSMKRVLAEPPEKKDYYRQKTKVLQLLEETKRGAAKTKKQDATWELAHKLSNTGEDMSATVDDKEQIKLKKRCKKVSMGLFSSVLDDLESELKKNASASLEE
jgi:hypothetical protein